MDGFINQLQSLVPEGFSLTSFFQAAALLCIGSLVLGFLGRVAFGHRSVLNQSVSSSIGILFIYAATVVIHSYGVNLNFLVSPLPFVSIAGDYLRVFSFQAAGYVLICGEVLSMIILAFLVNLVNGWLPQGKHMLGWLFFRCLSVALAMLLHALVTQLLAIWLPQGLLTWAPVILLGLLVLMLAVGALKFLVGAALSTVNPLIAVLYTFFFASVIGKQLSKAMLTTALIAALVWGLNTIGCTVIFIAEAALVAYLPLMIVLLLLWYLVGKIL